MISICELIFWIIVTAVTLLIAFWEYVEGFFTMLRMSFYEVRRRKAFSKLSKDHQGAIRYLGCAPKEEGKS